MVFNKDQLLRKSSIEELAEGDKKRLEKQFSEVELPIPKNPSEAANSDEITDGVGDSKTQDQQHES